MHHPMSKVAHSSDGISNRFRMPYCDDMHTTYITLKDITHTCASAMRIILQFTAGNIMGMRMVFFRHSWFELFLGEKKCAMYIC